MATFMRIIPAVLLPLAMMAPSAAAQHVSVDRTIPASAGQRLDLDLDAGGTVHVTGSNASRVHVQVSDRGRECRPECRVEVEPTSNGVRVHSYFVGDSDHQSSNLDVRVQVPQRFDVALHSMGGEVDIEGVSGHISGSTMGGALQLSRLGGELDLSTMGGDIHLSDSNVDGKVHTMGGDVVLNNVSGDVRGSTMGGKVTRTGAGSQPTGEVSMHTMGGEIEVARAPEGADVQTMGGDIHIGAAGDHVKARTMGGDITLDAVNGSVKATTMGGDVTVHMVGDPAVGNRSVEIRSMGGDIELVVPAGLAMQIEVELAYTRGHEGEYHVTSDFPLTQTVTPDWERDHGTPRKTITATGRTGNGKNPVHIRTVNGNVRIVKG